jgi:RsiW-degrading membrane proteinase PrsW (M82 family)
MSVFSSLFLVVLSFVPSFVWLLFYLREAPHPEPKPFLLIAFLLGVLAVGIALMGEFAALRIGMALSGASVSVVGSSFLFMFLGIAFVEEFTKFIVARILLAKNPVFDAPIDAMIYLVVIALGFAFVENIQYLATYSKDAAGAVSLIVVRFVGANLLHSLSSAIVGYFWAQGIVRYRQWLGVATGIVVATIVHGLFNVLALTMGAVIEYIGVLFLMGIGLWVLRDFEALKRISVAVTLAPYARKQAGH